MVAGYIVSAKNDGVAPGQLRRRISSFASVNGEEIGHWMESGSLTHDYANAITLLNSLQIFIELPKFADSIEGLREQGNKETFRKSIQKQQRSVL